MNPNYTPEFDPQECVRGLGQDWYHINEDLARVWLGITKDGESTHLEDRIARTKMPYINWNELLKDPHFQLLLHRVDQEQQKEPRRTSACLLQSAMDLAFLAPQRSADQAFDVA